MNENQTENNPRAVLVQASSSVAFKSLPNSSPNRPGELEFKGIVDQNNPNSVLNAKMNKVFQKRNYIYSKINETTPKNNDGNNPPQDEANMPNNDIGRPLMKPNNNTNSTLKLQRSYTQSFSGSPKAGSYFLDQSVDGAISLQNGTSGMMMLRNNNSVVSENYKQREDASSVRFAEDNHTVHHFDSEQKIESFFAILQKAAQKASGKLKKGILKNHSANYNGVGRNNSSSNINKQHQDQQLFNQSSILAVDEAKETEIVTTTQKTVRKRQISKQSSFQYNFSNQIRENIFTKAPKLKLLQLQDQLGKIDLTSSGVSQATKSKFQFQSAQQNNLMDQQQHQSAKYHSSTYSLKRTTSKQKQSSFTDVKEYQFEKKQYIQRISQQIDFDESRFLQLLFNSNEKKQSKFDKMILFGKSLFQRFLTLSVINVNAIIKDYEIHTQYPCQLAGIFLNIMGIGSFFFLYFFIYCEDWVESQIFLPFKSSFQEIYNTVVTSSDTVLAHTGVAFQILFIWLLLMKVSGNNLQLFLSERPAIKLIFCWGQVPKVLHEFKTYSTIAQNIYNQKSSILKNCLAVIAELVLLVADSIALHYLFNYNSNFIEQMDGNSNHNNGDFTAGLVQGILLGLLIFLNTLALQLISRLFIDRTSFSGFEWKLLTAIAFNSLFIFCGFQLKQAAIFSDSFDFPVLFNSAKESNAQVISYSQVQAEISFVLALALLVLCETFISYILSLIRCSSRRSRRVACEILITPADLNNSDIQENPLQKSNDQQPNQNNIDCKQQQFSTQFIEESDNRMNNHSHNTHTIHKIDRILQIKDVISSSSTPSRTIPKTQYPPSKPIFSSSSSIFRKAISVIVINSTLLTCVFTYPLALPLGIIVNSILIFSFYVDFRQYSLRNPYHSYVSTFLSSNEVNSLVSSVTYCFTAVSCILNTIIGLSNKNKSSSSIFAQGFNYIANSAISLNVVNILTEPILLYAIIAFLFVKLLQIYQQIQKQSSLFHTRKLIES